jgi:hypothetical protein
MFPIDIYFYDLEVVRTVFLLQELDFLIKSFDHIDHMVLQEPLSLGINHLLLFFKRATDSLIPTAHLAVAFGGELSLFTQLANTSFTLVPHLSLEELTDSAPGF